MNKIPLCEPDIGELEIKYVTEAVRNNMVSSSAPPVRNFENAFAKFFGAKYAIATNSGLSALFLVVKALGIGPGDEVIVPTFTMVATPESVSHNGATPVFADCGKLNPGIDAGEIEKKITSKTKAIIVAHLFGIPCDMEPIMRVAEKHNLPVIEDTAEAHGATYRGKFCGTFGKAGCFSFYASKIMTTGEGGMIITNDDALAAMAKRLREYDINPKQPYIHELAAWNLRMSALEAALGLAQLERLKELIGKRNAIAARYAAGLSNIKGLEFMAVPPQTEISTWLCTVLADRRDELVEYLAKENIDAKRVFVPMHDLPPYKQSGNFPNAEYLAEHGISLPSASTLSEKDQNYVIEKVKKFYSGQ
ncbi:MAG: DegT/DnrJ/EryC1/StrS family aminotransferase [Patescibacteria group bacterium]|nr:DegT/DnrJ/EryC1/StrS family aminotransferase [Patescibacteria group bacterium]MDE2015243.1 DegT/DnrJ/EryC1/StrS family aminotransferase [Patescibacteria group bacterium]MDE2227049.1 DegT/DnrJ/EryC1/StrS family aminotransferase [Patescibacteria group bacterium]